MLSLLSAAWWAAKAGAVQTGIRRFFNGASLKAVGLSIALVALFFAVAIGAAVMYRAGRAEGDVANAELKSRITLGRLLDALRERRAKREADERAAEGRQVLIERLRESTEHAVALERELAAIRDNPICYPATITEELRK